MQPPTTADCSTVAPRVRKKPFRGATHNYMRWFLEKSTSGEGLFSQVYSTTGTNYDSYCTNVFIATAQQYPPIIIGFRHVHTHTTTKTYRCDSKSISRGGGYPTVLQHRLKARRPRILFWCSEQNFIFRKESTPRMPYNQMLRCATKFIRGTMAASWNAGPRFHLQNRPCRGCPTNKRWVRDEIRPK